MRDALNISKISLGDEHPFTANIYTDIGHILFLQRKYKQALEFLNKAIKINRKLIDPDHPDLGFTSFILSKVLAIKIKCF